MKNIFQILVAALFLITLCTTCKKDEPVPITGIILNPLEFVLEIGDTATFTVTIVPENATNKTLEWESSDIKVVTVENGKVTGKARGKAKITVTSQDGGQTATAWVSVLLPELEVVFVEGGTFLMGCSDGDCYFGTETNELPQHPVTLSSFYITKYEITQKQWVSIMGSNPSYFKGNDSPVEQVSWVDVRNFIDNLYRLTGKKYRLPTEAEWEYAARGGNKSKGYKYSGSNNVAAVACYNAGKTFPVGTKLPNELGIYDMSGNVLEWCSDWYGAYTDEPQTNPQGPETPEQNPWRVLRGGEWASKDSWVCRVSSRTGETPVWRAGIIGFRLVLPAE